MPVKNMPVCMSIAGSDSGGGAGIQADLKAFTCFGTLGTTVITAITAQNPHEVTAVHGIPVKDVVAQFRAVMKAFNVGAIKTGMLYSAEIIEALAHELAEHANEIPLVVDPVMVSSSGAALLQDNAIDTMCTLLAPLATVITPNFPEAEIMYGQMMEKDEETAMALAASLAEKFDTAVLIKGGHLPTGKSTDILAVSHHLYRIATPQVESSTTHGTGCMLSSAIAANIALGKSAHAAIVAAKAYVYHNLLSCYRVGQRAYAMKPPRVNDESIVNVARIR